jgi:GAF domain-containing protein
LVSISTADSLLGKVVQQGKAVIDEDRPSNLLDFDNPPVVIPLIVDETTVGVIAIYATLEQKPRFSHTDFELFKLLGQHAAAALVGSSLFEQAGRKLPGAEAFRDLSV